MLDNKDYCDYETCVALREVGCRIQTEWYIHQPSYERGSCYLCFGIPRETSVLDECDYIPRLSLYEAQKWLRDEHQIHIMVDRFGQDHMWCIKEKGAIGITHQEYEDYVNYESALLGGIKYAIKLLKGE
jgi:hypothetical protein